MRTIKTSELRDMGIVVNKFIVSSPNPKHYRDYVNGRSGFVDMGTDYDGRTIQLKVTILPDTDYELLRDKVFRLFDSREPFYLANEGKRWLVKCNSEYSFARKGMTGETTIEFMSSSAYAESLGTTLDPITFRDEWNIKDLGLKITENDYIKTTNTFRIFNSGEQVNPRYLGLKIRFKGVSGNLTIKNLSNGTEWIYNGITTANDEILLDGVRSLKNGLSIVKNTNRKVITLEPGWNDFQISGSSAFEIKFEFCFYYL